MMQLEVEYKNALLRAFLYMVNNLVRTIITRIHITALWCSWSWATAF